MRSRILSWREMALYAGLWTILGLFSGAQDSITLAYSGQHVAWVPVYASALLNWWTCGIGTPLYVWLVRKHPLTVGNAWALAPVYAFALLSMVVVKYAVWVPLENLLFHEHWTLGGSLVPNVFAVFAGNLAFVVLLYAIEYYRSARDRQMQSAQLEGQLVEAQLDALRSQLQPHFLFNTLNGISTLMHRDVNAAEEMLSKLSDMLRLSMDSGATQETSLLAELQIMRLYVEIMQHRFGERFSIDVDIRSDLLGDRVPSFILQPLVENVIVHGMDEGSGRTHVRIIGDADQHTLTLRVIDNGRGLPVESAIQEGLGLSNSRRRIEQLYGRAGRLELRRGASGGTEVAITIPRRSAEILSRTMPTLAAREDAARNYSR
jgi:two-component system, LytTR family, sensor kinase